MCKCRIYLLILIAVIFSFSACSKTYKIGDICPAGGIVFYDKGVKQDGWRYLSAAPSDTEFSVRWSNSLDEIEGTDVAIGTGKQNTQIIADVLNQLGEKDSAAQLCLNLKVGRFSDWFLPSRGELDQMWGNLSQMGLGGFSNDYYWTSSQHDDFAASAWIQYFVSGNPDINFKNEFSSARAVRAF